MKKERVDSALPQQVNYCHYFLSVSVSLSCTFIDLSNCWSSLHIPGILKFLDSISRSTKSCGFSLMTPSISHDKKEEEEAAAAEAAVLASLDDAYVVVVLFSSRFEIFAWERMGRSYNTSINTDRWFAKNAFTLTWWGGLLHQRMETNQSTNYPNLAI
jgi:hypothetical protein